MRQKSARSRKGERAEGEGAPLPPYRGQRSTHDRCLLRLGRQRRLTDVEKVGGGRVYPNAEFELLGLLCAIGGSHQFKGCRSLAFVAGQVDDNVLVVGRILVRFGKVVAGKGI